VLWGVGVDTHWETVHLAGTDVLKKSDMDEEGIFRICLIFPNEVRNGIRPDSARLRLDA
jgi:hypothetical protein